MTERGPIAMVMDPRLEDVALLNDADERVRAERFIDPADARAFLVGRTLTRVVAGAFMGSPASGVSINRRCVRCGGPHGAPKAEAGPVGLSSSRRRSIVGAVAGATPVAIDVEPLEGYRLVPDTYLTKAELRADPDALGRLLLWTRKECLVKLGRCELDDFRHVTAGSPNERAAVVGQVRFDTTVLLGAVVTVASEGLIVPRLQVIGAREMNLLAASPPA